MSQLSSEALFWMGQASFLSCRHWSLANILVSVNMNKWIQNKRKTRRLLNHYCSLILLLVKLSYIWTARQGWEPSVRQLRKWFFLPVATKMKVTGIWLSKLFYDSYHSMVVFYVPGTSLDNCFVLFFILIYKHVR